MALYHLEQISKIFDPGKLLARPPGRKQVVKYFRINRIPYRLFYDRAGFMHMGISCDGRYRPSDLTEGLRIIESYIRRNRARRVLELAYGMGANLGFLAARNPEVFFTGLEICARPLRRYKRFPNLSFYCGDYHNLNMVPDQSLDLVFIIEALCYSREKTRVLAEIYRKLTPGGLLVIFDAYGTTGNDLLSPEKRLIKKLLETGMAVPDFEDINRVRDYFPRCGFEVVEERNLSQEIMPSLLRLNRLAGQYIQRPRLARFLNIFLPRTFVLNAVSGYLLPLSIKEEISCYYLHVLKVPEAAAKEEAAP